MSFKKDIWRIEVGEGWKVVHVHSVNSVHNQKPPYSLNTRPLFVIGPPSHLENPGSATVEGMRWNYETILCDFKQIFVLTRR